MAARQAELKVQAKCCAYLSILQGYWRPAQRGLPSSTAPPCHGLCAAFRPSNAIRLSFAYPGPPADSECYVDWNSVDFDPEDFDGVHNPLQVGCVVVCPHSCVVLPTLLLFGNVLVALVVSTRCKCVGGALQVCAPACCLPPHRRHAGWSVDCHPGCQPTCLLLTRLPVPTWCPHAAHLADAASRPRPCSHPLCHPL